MEETSKKDIEKLIRENRKKKHYDTAFFKDDHGRTLVVIVDRKVGDIKTSLISLKGGEISYLPLPRFAIGSIGEDEMQLYTKKNPKNS